MQETQKGKGKMLEIAVCEDLEIHRCLIKEKIAEAIDEPYEIVEFASAQAFKKSYRKQPKGFDIILMDIELGDGSGIELGEEINYYYPLAQIIYITSYVKHFSEVYATNHVWCIDKKELDEYLPKALHKALKALWHSKSLHLNFSWQKVKYAVIQDEIIYIERCLRVSEIHTATKVYRTSEKLDSLMEQLTDVFICCHCSYIVNMRNITKLQKNKVILNHDIEVPISRSKEEEMKKAYSIFLVK